MEVAEVAAEIATEILAEVLLEEQRLIASRTELKARVEIRQPKELEAFDSLRLSIEVAVEVLTEVSTEVAAARLGYYSQIQLIVPVIQAQQGLEEVSQRLS